MSENADSAATPSAQQQHNPPSLPASPHPKRVKTDDMVSSSTTTLPTMSKPQQTSSTATVVDNASTPTPSSHNPTTTTSAMPELSSLPPVSSLLPSISANPPSHMSNMPPLPQMPFMPNPNGAIPMPSFAPITMPIPPLQVKKLSADATLPTRGSAFAAGYDLYAAAPLTLHAKSKGLISTAIAIAVPEGTYGRVAPRSGLASKHFLDTGAGVIDADYRGEVKVLMFNFSDVDYEVKKGERVAQLVLERILTPEVIEVQVLDESVRGAGGFGSTGYI